MVSCGHPRSENQVRRDRRWSVAASCRLGVTGATNGTGLREFLFSAKFNRMSSSNMDLSTFIAVVGWVAGWALFWRLPTLRSARDHRGNPAPKDASDVPYSVVIPARNEAHHVGVLVQQLLAQTRPPVEVIVVDDHSDDDTALVAGRAGASLVQSRPLPEGWTGKSWACRQGFDEAISPVVVFLDADVSVPSQSTLVADAAERAASTGELVSVAPWHTVEQPYEWLSMPFGIVSLMGVGVASPVRPSTRGAFGPCIAVSRETYGKLGGHGSVAGEVVEDLALSMRADELGVPVALFGADRRLTYRMYPNGVRTLIEGWTKNIASGAANTPPIRAAGSAIWISGLISAMLMAYDGYAWSMLAVVAWAGQVYWMARQTGNFPLRSVLALPILTAAFVAIFIWSLLRTTVTRQVSWKGRSISLSSDGVGAGEEPLSSGMGATC